MPFNIVVPELSESVVEATVSNWLKQEGDQVEAGEVVVVLETDKVSLEVAADGSGTLSKIAQPEGADVTAGTVLGTVDGVAEKVAAGSPEQGMKPVEGGVPQNPAQESKQMEMSPQPMDAPANANRSATPVAQRVAAAHGVDIAAVPASGGKVTKNDVESFVTNQGAPAPAQPQPQPAPRPAASAAQNAPQTASLNGGSRREERQRMSRRRQTIAKRLLEAQTTAAMLTTFNEIDMSAVMEVRARRKDSFKEKFGIGLGFSSFFVKAAIGALRKFPAINAEIQENEIVFKHYYDIGMAIGAEEGLVVPVLRDADRMSFAEIELAIKDYANQVKEGTLSVEALRGGTFTITNGGVFGSLMSTPILNPPQVGILGLHAIKDRPVVVNGEIVVRPMMYVALTYDHRIVDGREAVQFLVRVKELIEDPETLLLEG